jgi:hypothetical protein
MILLFQGYLVQKADYEVRQPFMTSATGEILNHVKVNTTRKLSTLFGIVTVARIRYDQRRQSSQFPLDACLNLAEDQCSAGVRDRVAREATRGVL